MPFKIPRCEVEPLPHQQVAFKIDGREQLRWNYGEDHLRPFFFPFLGPSGKSLTRIGHPGAPDHDHHLSIWFAHNKVTGVNFWADTSPARVRQHMWVAYTDGDEEASMAVRLRWYDGHDPAELLEQELLAAIIPFENGEYGLELHSVFRPKSETLEFLKTNFGLLAVRVAKSLSVHFGGGQLSDSEGRVGEPDIFGKNARWMDYSGPVDSEHDEGITFYDHPFNPHYPTGWHVRNDGWMGASVCMHESITTRTDSPLTLRYLLHAHGGRVDAAKANARAEWFAKLPPLELKRTEDPHRRLTVVRSR